MTDRYAVIGNPIEHSKSPQIHAAFARQTGEDLSYQRILGGHETFEAQVLDFFVRGGLGLNVTVPFKERARVMADETSRRAALAGAVNTLIPLAGGRLRGENTDGVGLVTDLGCNQLFDFQGARVLILGAGGAARGVIGPLLEQGIDQLVIANRTQERAETLAEQFEGIGEVEALGFDRLPGEAFDLIINATAAGLSGEMPPVPADCLAAGGWVYDLMYGDQPTAFVLWGREHGAAKALDGLGMLVEQAAAAFKIWRGVQPDTEPVIRSLRAPEIPQEDAK